MGEALFNAPALLGGQAERAGLSCAGCHANGRRSAAFFLDGISADPGTADISSSFFAMPRANAVFDPKPIPDLAHHGKVSRDPARGELEPFLRGLIVEEFSGAEPSPVMLRALERYVRAVRACEGRSSEPRNLASDLGLLNRSVLSAMAAASYGDDRTARVLIKAARHRLGLIDERMAGPRLAKLRRRLLSASRELAPIEPAPGAAAIGAWHDRFSRRTVPLLVRAEPHSLYDPRQVDRWLAKRR